MDETLTGKVRHQMKTLLFGRKIIILQVEVSGIVTENNCGEIECETRTWWRDAKPEDCDSIGIEV